MSADELAEIYNHATAEYFKEREYDPKEVMDAVSLFLYSVGAADGMGGKYDD